MVMLTFSPPMRVRKSKLVPIGNNNIDSIESCDPIWIENQSVTYWLPTGRATGVHSGSVCVK